MYFCSSPIEYKQEMESCSHSQTVNPKECPLCRVKRAVRIDQRVPTLKKLVRHRSQQNVEPLPSKQAHLKLKKKQRTAYHQNFFFTETNYSRWIKKMEEKRLKTLPRPKVTHPEIDWSLFGLERHRPRFDRWESKFLMRLQKSGRTEEVLRNMSLY